MSSYHEDEDVSDRFVDESEHRFEDLLDADPQMRAFIDYLKKVREMHINEKGGLQLTILKETVRAFGAASTWVSYLVNNLLVLFSLE